MHGDDHRLMQLASQLMDIDRDGVAFYRSIAAVDDRFQLLARHRTRTTLHQREQCRVLMYGAMAGLAATLAASARADTHAEAQPNVAKRSRFARKTVLI